VIPTSRLTRVVSLLATTVAVALLAGCAVAPPADDSELTIVPAVVQTVQTALDVGGLHRVVTIRDVADASGLVPALILLHGASGSSVRMETVTGMTAIAEKAGFLVAYGDGTGTGRAVGGEAWNADGCCAAPAADKVDDIAYLNAVIDELVADHGVDPARVYLGGFSNGGMMSYRAACEIGERLAGIVVVGGALNVSDCQAPKALPVLVIHGTKDPTVPYAGGAPNPVSAAKLGAWTNASVADAAAYWSARDDCSAHSVVAESSALTDDRYDGCADGSSLEVISLIGGTHRWPTSANEHFNASAYIAKYFGLAS